MPSSFLPLSPQPAPAWDYPPLIINAALTGIVPGKKQTPHVPVQPDEIIADAGKAFATGASILHLHARDSSGEAHFSPDIYAEIIRGVREECPGAVICATTSGRNFSQLEQRSAVLFLENDLRPDMASLTLGSLNFPTGVSSNSPEMIHSLARIMQERGIIPELEIFDLGMIDYAHYLIERGILRPPFYFNLMLGSLGTMSATPLNLATLVRSLPAGSIWAAAGIGRFQFYANMLALASGGNVRVGIEDNLWLDAGRTELATNEKLIQRVVQAALAMGRTVASPADVRQLLALAPITN